MSTNGIITGTAVSLTILANTTKQVVQLDGRRDMFECSDKSALLESTPSDNGGLVDHFVVPKGWSGSIRADKSNGNFAALYSFLEANYYAGGVQQYFSITATIRSPFPAGKSERYQLTNAVFHGYKPGSYDAGSVAKSTVEFAAQQKIQLS